MIKEANAEGASSNSMEGMRKHIQRMAMASAMQELARVGKIVISGKNG
jgi:hypothetical protein